MLWINLNHVIRFKPSETLAKGIAAGLSSTVFVGVAALLLAPRSSGEEDPAQLISRRLVHVTAGESGKVIHLHVGDMLQVEPFDLPATPRFLNSTLQVRTEGARALEFIGQSASANRREGQTGRSAFLHALGPGRTRIHVLLAERSGRVIGDYRATYEVEVTASP